MIQRRVIFSLRQQPLRSLRSTHRALHQRSSPILSTTFSLPKPQRSSCQTRCRSQYLASSFHTSHRYAAQPPTADALMENLTDLYNTAKDEFEIAAEETEKKTVYAADDREAAKEALTVLKDAYDKAVRESDPETAREVQRRTGPRVKELENALAAVEEMAMED